MMKNLTNVNEAKKTLNIQDNSLGFINANDLKLYKKLTDKFISDEAKEIIDWLIVNNDTYVNDLGTKNDPNPLASFYNGGTAGLSEPEKILYSKLGTLAKAGKLLEVPVFQTKEQFNAIMTNKASFDSIILDLESEKGRNAVVRKYEPLIHKIIRQWVGKSNLGYEDLQSAAYEGFTFAMNSYGKKSKKTKADDEAISGYTFGQWAAYIIRVKILEAIKDESRTVRVPISVQDKEKKETGKITKNNSVSGDKAVGAGSDEEGGKTLFDFIGSAEDAGKNLDNDDLEMLWNNIFKKLEQKFAPNIIEIWYYANGINNHEKLSNKEISQKYNILPSNVTYYCYKVNSYIQSDKSILKMFAEVYELMKECIHDRDVENQESPLYIDNTNKINEDSDKEQE